MTISGEGRTISSPLPISFTSDAHPICAASNPCINGTAYTNVNTWAYCQKDSIQISDNNVASLMYINWLAIGF